MIDLDVARLEIRLFDDAFEDWDEPIPAIARMFTTRLNAVVSDNERLRAWLHAVASDATDAPAIRTAALNALAGMECK